MNTAALLITWNCLLTLGFIISVSMNLGNSHSVTKVEKRIDEGDNK